MEINDPGIPHDWLLNEWNFFKSLTRNLRQEFGFGLLGRHGAIQHAGHSRGVTGHRGECHMEESVAGKQAVAERLQPVRGDQFVCPGTVQFGTLDALHIHGVELEDAHGTIGQHELVLGKSARDRVVDLGGGSLPELSGLGFVFWGKVFVDEPLLVLNR